MAKGDDVLRKLERNLCMRCSNATAIRCAWIGRGVRTGLVKVKTRLVYEWRHIKKIELVYVLECKNYVEGPLPSLDRTA